MVDPTGMATDTTFWGGIIETINIVGNNLNNFRWPTWSYGIPIVGAAAESGNNLADGNYVTSLGNFGTSLAELFTAGYLSQYRMSTKMMSTVGDVGTNLLLETTRMRLLRTVNNPALKKNNW